MSHSYLYSSSSLLGRSSAAAPSILPVPIISDRLFFSVCSVLPPSAGLEPATEWFSIDRSLHYESFFSDFGPLNLGCCYRFCAALKKKLETKKVVFYCSPAPQQKSNAAVLLGIYCLLHERMTVEQMISLFEPLSPFMKFRDASNGPNSFPLSISSVLRGFHRALSCGFVDFDNFNVDEYEHFEKVNNGDLNLIVPGKFLAFAGPKSDNQLLNNLGVVNSPLSVSDLIPIFQLYGVTGVIRLNKKIYDRNEFDPAVFNHFDLFFPDGSTPPSAIVDKFMEICKNEKGMIAVHCKAGLGRTGSLIGYYLLSEYGFSAAEAIAWCRICRPGSIIGPQQNWLKAQEEIIRNNKNQKQGKAEENESQKDKEASKLTKSVGKSTGAGQEMKKKQPKLKSFESAPLQPTSKTSFVSHQRSKSLRFSSTVTGVIKSQPSNSLPRSHSASRRPPSLSSSPKRSLSSHLNLLAGKSTEGQARMKLDLKNKKKTINKDKEKEEKYLGAMQIGI